MWCRKNGREEVRNVDRPFEFSADTEEILSGETDYMMASTDAVSDYEYPLAIVVRLPDGSQRVVARDEWGVAEEDRAFCIDLYVPRRSPPETVTEWPFPKN